jgi:hypothetical protein
MSRETGSAVRFGGASNAVPGEDVPADLFQRFTHYIGQIWVNEHEPPTDAATLATFDLLSIKPDYDHFLAAGRRVDYTRGLTLEEAWLSTQLAFRQELICVIAEEANATSLNRIVRKAVMPAASVCELLAAALERETADRQDPHVQTFTYGDGVGHVVAFVAYDRSASIYTYFDPWPGMSLLASWVNKEVTSVVPAPGPERLWLIVADELPSIMYAVMLPMPLWQRLHGEETAASTPPPATTWPTPAELTDEQRQDVLNFYLTCANAGLLTAQGNEDFQTVLESGALWDVDQNGNTTLDNLKLLVRNAQEPATMLNLVLRHIADPSSIHQ